MCELKSSRHVLGCSKWEAISTQSSPITKPSRWNLELRRGLFLPGLANPTRGGHELSDWNVLGSGFVWNEGGGEREERMREGEGKKGRKRKGVRRGRLEEEEREKTRE